MNKPLAGAFYCPICDWRLAYYYYRDGPRVRMVCHHCHLGVEMHFDRHAPEGWPVTAQRHLDAVRERMWGGASASFEQLTLPTLTNNGVAG